ncbi:MAG: Gfo/Idh/MocA family oxidoreductase [Melioribacteraceae bacterium]|nr:Gfo/Idh/MocA family oxidoreductase [Melioribacteraceae bacterium]
MKKNLTRRQMLKTAGLFSASIPLLNFLPNDIKAKPIYFNETISPVSKPVTAIVIGAGARGNIYASYSLKYPEQLKIVGVAEPIKIRREKFSKTYSIEPKYQWNTWEDVFQHSKLADAVIITTPDHLHYGPAMAALKNGYDLLLEKPIAQTWSECSDILNLTKEKNKIVGICHVLRYTPYFRKMKEVVSSGVLGDIVSIQHLESVQHVHMSHSFVRGNWRNTKESNFMLIAKSCHDLDILRWMTNKNCVRVSSFGSLKHFKEKNAPVGSTLRCTDGCKVESSCPYSALKIYYKKRTWLHHFDLPENKDEQGTVILENLKNGPYGRCVYHCDNDVVDHQIVNLEFQDDITVAFSMEAFTSYHGRKTRIMGSMGDIVGDEETLIVNNFRTDSQEVWDAKNVKIESGHGGGDFGLMKDWIQAVDKQDEKFLSSNIEASMESHLIGFKAEESRLTGKIIEVKI